MTGVISAAAFRGEDLSTFTAPPAWRKATRNMVMAAASIQRALAKVPKVQVAGSMRVGFVLGSCSGELDTSVEFLSTWAKSAMARPVLFQNSLHNATTGFCSIQLQQIGPSFTVSSLENTPGECLALAEGLLREGLVDYCLVTLIEGHKFTTEMLGFSPVLEGACTFVLGRKGRALEGSKEYRAPGNHRPLIDIQACDLFRQALEWTP